MNVLVLGSGGREHAIAWKVRQSRKLEKLYVLPGNPGTAQLAENVTNISVDDQAAVASFCREKHIDLVIVGPEAPLADGIVDTLSAEGIRCFGPKQAAARIESSKVFAKDFMRRHDIPTARYATFSNFDDAVQFVDSVNYPIVIKASGLAAGKGVILPETKDEAKATLKSILIEEAFGNAGAEVVIEERLTGQEVSLMAFTDGTCVVLMLPAQDHKRLLDGDEGPNTGGMGAYAPAPTFTMELTNEATELVLKSAIAGLKSEGTPFVGVLYAGLILTPNGIRVLEFNSRFGDPETQVVLPLLETDLLEIAEACVNGTLQDIDIRWKKGTAVCVVLASKGYPEKAETGKLVMIEELPEDVVCFHAGTRKENDNILTSGGRVLGLTAWAKNINTAVRKVYASISKISFEGMHYRQDIAYQALFPIEKTEAEMDKRISDRQAEYSASRIVHLPTDKLSYTGAAIRSSVLRQQSAYSSSGVNIDAGNRAVELMKDAVRATYTDSVLAGIGSFGGLFDVSALKQMDHPVLVASTDGVGTKVKLAATCGRFRGIGHDIVNHCINDILVQGAKPLFFMDYFAASKLNPEQAAEVVTGIAEACKEAGMALLGGETAEMPGVYQPHEFDVAGTIVGVLERDQILPRATIHEGDVLIGFASSGPHTNGYSLLRKIFADTELENSLADVLLATHRSYFNVLYPHLSQVKALAHITGGGFLENIPRILPENLGAMIHLNAWDVPDFWKLTQQKGNISTQEMYRVFNMGIGMIAIVDKSNADAFQASLAEQTFVIGELVKGERKVILN